MNSLSVTESSPNESIDHNSGAGASSATTNFNKVEEDYDFEGSGNQLNEPRGSGFGLLKRRNTMKKGIVSGAAVAGGVTGLVVAGPVVGIVGAVGAGALATQNNKAGDVARASGDVVLTVGDRAKDIDEKHNVVQKVKNATGSFVRATRRWNREHKVTDKVIQGIIQGLKFISDKFQPQRKMITNGKK